MTHPTCAHAAAAMWRGTVLTPTSTPAKGRSYHAEWWGQRLVGVRAYNWCWGSARRHAVFLLPESVPKDRGFPFPESGAPAVLWPAQEGELVA